MSPISIKRPHADGAFIVDETGSDRCLVEMSIGAYARCLPRCDEKSPEYGLLRNGIILHDDPHKMVYIRCDTEKARVIRRIVAKECPGFLDEVHVYPDPA